MSNRHAEQMTLLFELAALRRLERPSEAVDDAREWSDHIGIVTDGSPAEIAAYADESDIAADFTSGEGELAGSLAVARQRFPTDRHVFVGVSDSERRLTQSLGWEYLDIADAAEAADWKLADS